MKLHIKDRIYIPQMFPQKSTFLEFNLKRSIIRKVGIKENDKDLYNIKEDHENGRITWDVDKDMSTPLCVSFSKDEIKYLQESCEKLIDTAYPDDFWSVVEKIYDTANS